MDIDSCVIVLVNIDGEPHIKISRQTNDEDHVLHPLTSERGQILYEPLRQRLQAGPIICQSRVDFDQLMAQVESFHTGRQASKVDLSDVSQFMQIFIRQTDQLLDPLTVIPARYPYGFGFDVRQLYQELNQPPSRPGKLDRRV